MPSSFLGHTISKVQFKSLLQMKPHICKYTGEIYAEVPGQIRKKGPRVGARGREV